MRQTRTLSWSAGADTGRQRVVPFSDILVADLMSYYTYGTYTYSEFDAEGQLTSAVDYVTSDNSHILYLAENHGESALGGSAHRRHQQGQPVYLHRQPPAGQRGA